MQKFLRTLMLMALMLVPFASQAQGTDCAVPANVIIGDSNSTSNQYYTPVNCYYKYSLTETIIDADEIGGPMVINSISYFYATANTMTKDTNVTIYIQPTTKSVFSSSSDLEVLSSDAVMVYQGPLNCTTGWNTFTFTTPYNYSGQGNLMIIVDNNSNAYDGSAYKFANTNCTGYKTLYWYSDSQNPDPTNSTFSGSKSYVQYRVVMSLNGCDLATCHKPTITTANFGSTTADFAWTSIEAGNYIYTLSSNGTVVSTGNTTATSISFDNLVGNTEYIFSVCNICSATDTSANATAYFRTQCATLVNLPYTMGFEENEIVATTPSADALPHCWNRINDASGTSNYYPYSYSSYARTGSRDLYFYSSTTTTYATNQLAVLPQLDVTLPVNTLQLSFWVRGGSSYGSNLEVGTMSDPTDNTTFTTVQTIAVPVGSTYENHVVYFMNAPATDRYIAFRLVRGSSTQYAYVDDVVLDEAPSCFLVSNAGVDTADATSVTLSWSDNMNTGATYSIYNMADNSLIASGITAVPGANNISYVVTGLTGNTGYNFGIVANCSATDASDTVLVSGRTACVTIATLPWEEGFEEVPTGSYQMPYCWTRINDATGTYNYYPYSYTSYVRTGSRDLYFYSPTTTTYAANQLAVLPQLDVTLPVNTLQLSFWVRGGSSYGSNLEVGTMSDPTDNTTFTTIETIVVPASATYENHIVYFMNAPATDSYIAFRLQRGNSTQYAYVDDVVLDEAPSCFPVTNLTAFNITDSSATLSWDDNMNNGATYTIMNSNTVLATNIPANADSIAIVGLSEGTIYNLAIVANCSADDASEPVSVTFQTLVSPVTSFPYATGFESGEDANWMLFNDNTNAWHIGSAVNNGGSNSLYISNDNGISNAYTVSGVQVSYATRPLSLSDTNYYVIGFDWRAYGEGNYDYLRAFLVPGDYIPTAAVTPDGSTPYNFRSTTPDGWIDLNPDGGKLNLQNEWQNIADTLFLQPGSYTVVLMWANDASGGTQPPVAVDNFSFAPYVPVPLTVSNLHGDAIAHNAFTAVWNGNDRQTMWACGLQGPADSVINWFMTYSMNRPFFELTPNTTYNVYVKAFEPVLGYFGDSVMTTVTTGDLPVNCTVIAEGNTTNNYVPLYGYWADNAQRVQSIYPASMLTGLVGQTFTSMHYFVSSGSSSNWGSGTWNVKLGITTQENLSDGFDATAITTYYTGNLSASTTDGMTITFDQPFTYNGGNLLVEFEQPAASGYTQCYFYGVSATGASRYVYGSTYQTASGTVQNFLPQVQFCAPYQTTCYNIDHLVVNEVSTTTANIYWYPGNVETEWEVAFGTGDVDLTNPMTVTANQLLLNGLTADADYWFYVRPVCDSVTYGNWTSTTFTTLPTCAAPNSSTVYYITDNSATVIVDLTLAYGNASSVYVKYWPADAGANDTNTVSFSTANNCDSVNLAGLMANTVYNYQVYVYCGSADGSSRWTSVSTFRTACDAVQLPFTEDFSATLNSDPCWRGVSSVLAADVFAGTATLNLGTPSSWTYASSANSGIEAGHYYKNIYGSSCKSWLITPAIDLSTATSAQLTFDAVFTGYNSASAASGFDNNSSQAFMVIVSADGGNTWLETNATKWQNENGNYTLASLAGTSYMPQVINLNQYLGDTIKIAFYAQSTTSGGDNNLHIDNIVVSEIPNCPAPYGVTVAYNGGTTAIVSWNGEANGYNLNINGTTTYNVNNPDTITGLDLATTYTFMVQSACGNDTSAWSNPASITTDMCVTEDQCFITLSLTDSYGDSWNGNAIVVIDSITGTVLGQYANQDADAGVAENYTIGVCSGRPLQFSWVSGSYPSEASFTILDGGNTAVFSGSGSNMTGGQVFFTLSNPCPNCLPVENLTASNVTSTSATISWTGTAASYDVYNGTTVVAAGITATTYTFTGLTAATAYTFGVVANCSADDASGIATIIVNTDCADGSCHVTIAGVDSYGDGWNGNTITVAQAGTTIADFTIASGSNNTESYCVTSGVPVTFSWATGSYPGETSFDIYNGNNVVVYNVSDGSTLTDGVFFTLNNACSNDTTGGDTTVVVPDTVSITFAVNDTTMGTTVPAPGTYQYVAGSPFSITAVPNTGYHLADMQVLFMGQTYTLGNSSLTYADTAETFYDGLVITAVFAQDVVCPDSVAIPFTEGFENGADCWTAASLDANSGVVSNATYAYEGNGVFVFSYNTNPPQYLISPLLAGTGSSLQVELYYRVMSATYPESFQIGYSTTTNDTSAFVWATEQTNLTNLTYEHYVEVLNAAGIKYVAIKYTANDMYYLFIDNVLIRDVPTCATVTNLAVDATTQTSVTLSWTDADNTGATYTVYNDNTVVATGITGTTYTVTGLTAATNYTFGVVANCSATDASDMTTVAASTLCDVISTFPYTQDFSAAPACWSAIDADGDGQNWQLINGAIHSASYDNTIGVLYPDNWLITPQFQFAAGTNYEVTWNADPQDASYPAEHYGLYVSTTTADTGAFTLLQEWTLTANGHVPVVDLSAYSGQTIFLAFRHWNCYDMFRIAIDNFQVRAQAGANQITVSLTQNNPMYGSVNGGGVYTIGDSVTVTATASDGYVFSRWADTLGTTVSTENPYTFVAATDITLNAVFISNAAETYTITVTVNDSTMGTATGSGTYSAGDVAVLTATANAGFEFVNWTQNGLVLSTNNPFSTTVTSNSAAYPIVANFAPATVSNDITIVLAVNDATMGTTNPVPGTYTFAVGDSASVTAIANNGYHFVNWTVSMGGIVVDSSLTNANYSIDALPAMLAGMTLNVMANFAADSTPQPAMWTVTLSSADSTMGTVSPAGDTEVADGTSFTATATPNEGYQFSAWMSGNTVVSLEATYTFTVSTNIALVAVFLPDSVEPETRYHVTGEANDATMGYVTGSGYYLDGSVATLTAHAYEGYRFVRWSTGETTETINITVDGEDVTVTAYFEAVTGIEDADMDDVTIYSTDSKIVVRGAEGSSVYVFDVNGRLVSNMVNATETVEFRMANTGVYLVKVGAAPAKRVLVVR